MTTLISEISDILVSILSLLGIVYLLYKATRKISCWCCTIETRDPEREGINLDIMRVMAEGNKSNNATQPAKKEVTPYEP